MAPAYSDHPLSRRAGREGEPVAARVLVWFNPSLFLPRRVHGRGLRRSLRPPGRRLRAPEDQRLRGPAGDEHRRSFLVHTYEIDPDGRLAPRALCAYLQEAAGEDAARLGVSMTRLMEDRLAWVLQRLRLEVSRYPRGGETLTVTTWARRFDRAIAWRDFEVHDESGARMAAATSRWAVFDVETRRVARLPAFVRAVPVADRPPALGLDSPAPGPPTGPAGLERRFEVRRGDLDVVRHLNNTRYVEWALETVPEDVLALRRPTMVDVEFRREALLGDTVVARSRPSPDEGGVAFLHELRSARGDAELARAASRWDVLA